MHLGSLRAFARAALRAPLDVLPGSSSSSGKRAIALSALLLMLLWSNSRILILRHNQNPANPIVLAGYYAYHGMAAALEEGRVGQLDVALYREYKALSDPYAPYQPRAGPRPAEFVNYYKLDVGYSFIVELARLLFPSLPDNYLRSLALQLLADLGVIVLVFYLYSEWHVGLGLAGAFLYVGNKVFLEQVSVTYYYFWDVPFTFIVLGALALAYRRPEQARRWLALGGAVLGFGVWLRASWWPLTVFCFAVVLTSRLLRRKALVASLLFGLLAVPQVWRASRARGHLNLSTRATWHVALVGLGYYPNAYGLQPTDEAVFRLTREKYRVVFPMEDYGPEDEAAKKEYISILRRDPAFVVRSFLGRLKESLLGTTKTSMPDPFPFLPSTAYRALCILGLTLMVREGGERRLLGWAATGMYLVYVTLTSVFYFVGLAYDNVSQVALFVLFMGLLDGTARTVGEVARRWGETDRESDDPQVSSSPSHR